MEIAGSTNFKGRGEMRAIKVILRSAGAKNADFQEKLKGANFLLDCRVLPDPSSVGLGGGYDEGVQEWVKKNALPAVYTLQNMTELAIRRIPLRRRDKEDITADPFIILCVCAHGVHRSVSAKCIITKGLQENPITIQGKDGEVFSIEVVME